MSRYILFFLLLCHAAAMAQNTQPRKGVFGQPVMPGPGQVLVFAYDTTRKTNQPDKNAVFHIYRDDTQKGFKKLAQLAWPSSAKELEKRLGEALSLEIIKTRKLKSTTDLLQLLEAGKMDTLGIYLTNLKVWEAMGMLYIDKERSISDIGTSYRIDIEKLGSTRTLYQPSIQNIRFSDFAVFKQYDRVMNDSLVMITWYAKGGRANAAMLFAGDARTKIPANNRLIVYSRKDTLFASVSLPALPGQQFSSYVRATDMAGNTGYTSDTVQLMALTTTKALSIQHFRATDTLGGLLLQWDALPSKAYYTGIQLFKSRSATDEYIVVDTLPVTAISYLDKKVLSGVQYYYAVEPILFNLPSSGKVTPAQATTSVKGSKVASAAPLPPQGLYASLDTQRNVVLAWEPNSETDLFAYYVLRGTSPENMQVISPPVRDTLYVDSLSNLSGGISYLYALRAINMEQLVSDTSQLISILPPKARLVSAPSGLSARYSPQGVILQWNDVSETDDNVAGYALYRRRKGDEKFQLLNQVLINGNYYTDSSSLPAGVFEYGLTAADAFGNQSIFSPTAELNTEDAVPIYPPADLNLRNLPSGIVITVPAAAGDQRLAGGHYIIYRRTPAANSTWKKVGEMPVSNAIFIDKSAEKDQLYVYAISINQQNKESRRSLEKSIRVSGVKNQSGK